MGAISRTKGSFRIGADVFKYAGALPDVTVVTNALRIEPTRAHSAGERRPATGVYKSGMWTLDSPLAESAELETHLRWLLDRLLPAREQIHNVLDSDPRLKADFFCGLWLREVNEGLELTPETLTDIGSLRATLSLDVYSDGEDEG